MDMQMQAIYYQVKTKCTWTKISGQEIHTLEVIIIHTRQTADKDNRRNSVINEVKQGTGTGYHTEI